jgi:tetratricopeptide (TPR) repeat protein
VLHRSIGNTSRAEGHFAQALDIDPDNLGALYNLGVMAAASADWDSASGKFEQLLDAHPAYLPGLVSLTAVLQQQGSLAEIRPRLMAAIALAPDTVEPRVLLARVEMAEGEMEAALDVIRGARENFPNEAGLDYLEGFALLKSERYEDAANAARDYLRSQPSDVRGLSLLVDAEIRSGNATKVRDDVKRFQSRNPDIAQVNILAGDVELAMDSPQAAVTYYEAAAKEEWTRVVAIRLARARQAAGAVNMTESLERWLSDNPTDAGIRLMSAQLLEANGEADRAVGHYKRLQADGNLGAVGMNNMAWQYHLKGNSEAVALAEEAHRLAPDNGSITDTLGWILFKAGETDRAVELLTLAASQSPDNSAIQDHLNSALAEK